MVLYTTVVWDQHEYQKVLIVGMVVRIEYEYMKAIPPFGSFIYFFTCCFNNDDDYDDTRWYHPESKLLGSSEIAATIVYWNLFYWNASSFYHDSMNFWTLLIMIREGLFEKCSDTYKLALSQFDFQEQLDAGEDVGNFAFLGKTVMQAG